MDRKLIAFFVISFALFSCSPAREEAESVLLVTSERVAAADSVFYPLANVQNCYILGDTLLVARHLSDAGTRAFSVYDIRTHELVRSLDYGADDAAVLSVALTVSPEGVLIHDFVKERMALLSPEAVGRPGPVEFRPTNISSQQSVAVSGGRIMYLNPASFEGEAERLLLSDEQYQGPPEKRRGYDNFDVVMGYILPARDGSRTYFVSRNTGEIELYDAEQKLLKQVRMANAPTPEYSFFQAGDVKQRVFRNYIPYSFVSVFSDDSRVSLLFDPHYFTANGDRSYLEPSASLLILDWQGTIVKSLSLPAGMHPDGCYVSPDGKVDLLFCEPDRVRRVAVR